MNIQKSKFITTFYCLILAICFLFTGCKTWDTEEPEETPAMTESPVITTTPDMQTAAPQPTVDLSLYAVNPFTGIQDMDKSNIGKRPIAIMISNIKKATPQAGITECDMFYEVEAEGGITRIMGLFADVSKVPTIGPIRSAREYHVDLSLGYNAIFAHFGTSTSAKARISKYTVNNLDGMSLSSTFWRDQTRLKNKGLEHSALTSGTKLKEAIDMKKYKTDTGFGGGAAFEFFPQNSFTIDGTKDSSKVTAKFSGSYISTFIYDAKTRLYGKNQFDAPHVDEKGKQIKVTNVIVIQTSIKSVGNADGHLAVDLSSGSGYYFSGGKYKEIKWSKGDIKNPIKYTNTDGTPLKVNAGKTYVCIVKTGNYVTIS